MSTSLRAAAAEREGWRGLTGADAAAGVRGLRTEARYVAVALSSRATSRCKLGVEKAGAQNERERVSGE